MWFLRFASLLLLQSVAAHAEVGRITDEFPIGRPTMAMQTVANPAANGPTSITFVVDKPLSASNVDWAAVKAETSWANYLLVLAALAYPTPPAYDAGPLDGVLSDNAKLGLTGFTRFKGTSQNSLPKGFWARYQNRDCIVAFAGTQGLTDLTTDVSVSRDRNPPASLSNWLLGNPTLDPPLDGIGYNWSRDAANFPYADGTNLVTVQNGTFDYFTTFYQTRPQSFKAFADQCMSEPNRTMYVIGHSMGGFFAQFFGLMYNGACRKKRDQGNQCTSHAEIYLYNSAPVFEYSKLSPTFLDYVQYNAANVKIWGRPLDPLSMLAVNAGGTNLNTNTTNSNPARFLGIALDWGALRLQDLEMQVEVPATAGAGGYFFKHNEQYSSINNFPNGWYPGTGSARRRADNGSHVHSSTAWSIGVAGWFADTSALNNLNNITVPWHTAAGGATGINDWLWHYFTLTRDGRYAGGAGDVILRSHNLDDLILMKYGKFKARLQTPRLASPVMWSADASECWKYVYDSNAFARAPAGVGDRPRCRWIEP